MHLILLRHCARVDKTLHKQKAGPATWLANFDPPVDINRASEEMDTALRHICTHIAPEPASKKLQVLIHCSPYNRCIQTAELLLAGIEKAPELNPTHFHVSRRLRIDQALSEWLSENFNLNYLPPNDDGYSIINNVNTYLNSPETDFGVANQTEAPTDLNSSTRTHLKDIRDPTWSYNALGHCGDYGEPPLEFKRRCFDYLTSLLQYYYRRQPYSADKNTVLIVISHGAVISTLLQMLLNRPIFSEIPLCTPVYFKQSLQRRTVFSLMDYDFNLNKILSFSSDRQLYRLLETPIDMSMMTFEDSLNELATIGTRDYTTILQSPTQPGHRRHKSHDGKHKTHNRHGSHSHSRTSSFGSTYGSNHSSVISSRASSRPSSIASSRRSSFNSLKDSSASLHRSSAASLSLASFNSNAPATTRIFSLMKPATLAPRRHRSNTINIGTSRKDPEALPIDESERAVLRQTHSSRQLDSGHRTFDLNKLASYFNGGSSSDDDEDSSSSESSSYSSDEESIASIAEANRRSVASLPRITSLSSLNSLKNSNSAANSIREMMVDPSASAERRSSLASEFLKTLLGDPEAQTQTTTAVTPQSSVGDFTSNPPLPLDIESGSTNGSSPSVGNDYGVLSFGGPGSSKLSSQSGLTNNGNGIIEGTFNKVRFNSNEDSDINELDSPIEREKSEITLISTLNPQLGSDQANNTKDALREILFADNSSDDDASWFGFNRQSTTNV